MPKTYLNSLRIIMAVSLFAVGLFYELTSALVSVVLFAWLVLLSRRQELGFRRNAASVTAIAVYIGYCVSILWAVDKGLSVWGVAKYLPVPLMALCLLQTSSDERSTILEDLPWIGALMVVVSFALHYIPALYSLFTSRDRLAGFFQYPNTFACFMLLGIEILILNEEKINVRRVLCALVLVFGLVQSGSRTVFVLAIPALLVSLFIRLRKNPKALVIGAAAIVLAFAVMILALGGSYSVSHLLALSSSESTLLGRLLYWKDALPVIGNHPFGLGYLGYYMSHGSFQTGLYSVRWVHNELLQMLLDIGWIPTVIAIVAVVKAVVAKQPAVRKVVLLTLLAHCMMDFDLEYIAMYFILLVCLDWDTGKTKTVKLTVPAKAVAAVLILGSLYIGVGSTLYYSGKVEASVKVYPWNTQARMELLTQAETAEEMDEQADAILALNDHIALAWDAKAEAAYSRGDFGAVIDDKNNALANTKYIKGEYVDYFNKLAVGYQLYMQAGDTKSAQICLDEIIGIQDRIDRVLASTDELAWKITDKPYLVMPDEYNDFVAAHK